MIDDKSINIDEMIKKIQSGTSDEKKTVNIKPENVDIQVENKVEKDVVAEADENTSKNLDVENHNKTEDIDIKTDKTLDNAIDTKINNETEKKVEITVEKKQEEKQAEKKENKKNKKIESKIKKDLDDKINFAKKQVEVEQGSIYDTKIYREYDRKKPKEIIENIKKQFDKNKTIAMCITVLFVGLTLVAIYKILTDDNAQNSLYAVSKNISSNTNIKNDTINNILEKIDDYTENHSLLSPTNLNLINRYDTVLDDNEKVQQASSSKKPAPVSLVSVEKDVTTMDSVVGQIWTKLINKHRAMKSEIYNMISSRPVNVVRSKQLDGTKILAQYNPDDTTHKKDKPITWFVNNYTNVKINFKNYDNEDIEEYENIKDIISMANVYTYYHNPYDIDTFLTYCYNLYDNSIMIDYNISDVYYCTGCMTFHENVATSSFVNYDNVKNPRLQYEDEPGEQKLKREEFKKTGIINRMDMSSINVNDTSYKDYIENYENYNTNNYCPGHIDLYVDVYQRTIDETEGLFSIDTIGNKGTNWTVDWHGWDLQKKAEVKSLTNKDWNEEYNIGISYTTNLKPLTQEEINYYLSKLDKNISKDRYEVIKVALESVGKIPYYYAGKPRHKGYSSNNFGTQVKADYKGRVLNGLDCSGWINWVYWTALNKRGVSANGTAKLVNEGEKIRRYELLPGDVIVRSGYDSHVMMFYEWEDDGRMRVIHENGTVDNVSIGLVEGYYPYYRRLIK